MIYCTDVEKSIEFIRCDILDRKHHMWKIRPNFSSLHLPKISNVKFRLNMSNMRNMIEYFTDVNNLTKFVKVITYSAEYITCEKSDRISHTYILPKCVTCKKFDRICHLWRSRSNTLQLWNYGKIDLIRHTVVTHLTENITYEKYVPISIPIIHQSVSRVTHPTKYIWHVINSIENFPAVKIIRPNYS